MTELELLAPARDVETGIAAIDCGADAVYIGAPHHGARAAASNSVDDIARLCAYAHRFGAKVYVALNTLVYDNEIESVRSLVDELYRDEVDALIVQDMALLDMDLPPIALHASTQCDIRTPEKARFLESVGFEQLVLPREMNEDDIRKVRAATAVPLEAFVHGALCVSYSGDCRASFVNGGRSANRGECAQICRLRYSLKDGDGRMLVTDRHLLSLKDLNRMAHLGSLADAGVSSLKIEGRLKSAEYVRNVTAAYSRALDELVRANPNLYRRASFGHSEVGFEPDVTKTFNRGYTTYFVGKQPVGAGSLASMDTPKHVGECVAEVLSATRRSVRVRMLKPVVNGDGLGFFDAKDSLVGFRVNRVDGNVINLATELQSLPAKGTGIYRNFDKKFNDTLLSSRSRRSIRVNARLSLDECGSLTLELDDERGNTVAETVKVSQDKARSSQKETRTRALTRTGDTIYDIVTVDDTLSDDIFIPVSALAELRRKAIEKLDTTHNERYRAQLLNRPHRKCNPDAVFPKDRADMHDNVANRIARNFYERHGVTVSQPAIELGLPRTDDGRIHVMTSRYCVRRELGACLKTPGGRKIRGPLTLIPSDGRTTALGLEFDCDKCLMNVFSIKRSS